MHFKVNHNVHAVKDNFQHFNKQAQASKVSVRSSGRKQLSWNWDNRWEVISLFQGPSVYQLVV